MFASEVEKVPVPSGQAGDLCRAGSAAREWGAGRRWKMGKGKARVCRSLRRFGTFLRVEGHVGCEIAAFDTPLPLLMCRSGVCGDT